MPDDQGLEGIVSFVSERLAATGGDKDIHATTASEVVAEVSAEIAAETAAETAAESAAETAAEITAQTPDAR